MSLLVPRRLRCELGSVVPFNGGYEVAEGSTIDLEWRAMSSISQIKAGLRYSFVSLMDNCASFASDPKGY